MSEGKFFLAGWKFHCFGRGGFASELTIGFSVEIDD